MQPATRNATFKRDKSGLLSSFLTAGFWESLGRYLKNAAAATYRSPLLLAGKISLRVLIINRKPSALPPVGEGHGLLAYSELERDQ